MTYDLTIVGAGLVGATTALALAEQGHRVRLYDRQAALLPSDKPDLRVVALNLASIEWLKSINIWPNLDPARLGEFTSLCVEDQAQSLCFDAASEGLDKLGVIVENNLIIGAAQGACMNHPKIDCHFAEEFEYDPSCRDLIIAADGAHSQLRQALNIPCFTHDYTQKAWISYVKLEKPHNHQAWQIFLPTGPLAFLPMHDPYTASIVWTLPKESLTEVTSESVTEASGFHYGSVELASAIASFPLRLQLAEHYFKKNVVFLGDAIHSIHPLAGQGVNLGFADAQCLVALLMKHPKSQWTNPVLLKRFQRERKLPNTVMAHSMSAINLLFRQENPWIVSARKQGLAWVDKLPLLKQLFRKGSS